MANSQHISTYGPEPEITPNGLVVRDSRDGLRDACLERARAVVLAAPLPPWLRDVGFQATLEG